MGWWLEIPRTIMGPYMITFPWSISFHGTGMGLTSWRPRCSRTKPYGGFHKWWLPNSWMVYNGKILLTWMIWGYPHFRKPPYGYMSQTWRPQKFWCFATSAEQIHQQFAGHWNSNPYCHLKLHLPKLIPKCLQISIYILYQMYIYIYAISINV